jgi:hypothetical protein
MTLGRYMDDELDMSAGSVDADETDILEMASASALVLLDDGTSTRLPFQLDVCQLGVPSVKAVGRLQGQRKPAKTRVSVEAARRFAMTFAGMPARVSRSGESHKDGNRKAPPCGHITSALVVTRDGGEYLRLVGELWPMEQPERIAAMRADAAAGTPWGGSFEMIERAVREGDDGIRDVDEFDGCGVALLRQAAAAFGEQTELAIAEAQAGGKDEEMEDDSKTTPTAGAADGEATASPAGGESPAGSEVGGAEGGTPGYADSLAMIADLTKQNAEKDARIAQLEDLVGEYEWDSKWLQQNGYKNLWAAVYGLQQVINTLRDRQVELENELAAAKGQATTMEEALAASSAELVEVKADLTVEQMGAKIPAEQRAKFREMTVASLKGEPTDAADLVALAAGIAEAKPAADEAPDGDKAELAEPVGAASGEEPKTYDHWLGKASERVKRGEVRESDLHNEAARLYAAAKEDKR